MKVHTGALAQEVRKGADGKITVVAKSSDGKESEFVAGRLLMAVGRRSNADLLNLENTGVQMDRKGFIEVVDYLETTKKHLCGGRCQRPADVHPRRQPASVAGGGQHTEW